MKITFIVPTLNFTGGLRVIAIYAEYLSKFGHHVTVITPGKKTPSLFEKLKAFLKRKKWDGDKHFSTIHFDSISTIDLKILEKSRPVDANDVPDSDIVIATWWATANWVNEYPASKGKKVYFMQDYGGVPWQPLDKIQETWMLPFHIITISQWLKSLIVDFKLSDSNITLIPNGVDLSLFHAPRRNKNKFPTIGFLYTGAPQKGIELMTDAYLKAKEHIPSLRLHIFGSMELSEIIKKSPDVTYYQKIDDAKVVEVYSSCDAWLFGSVREGFGLPILEAMACRTPVIATKAGAAEELVSKDSGALLATRSVDEMASEILKIVNLDNEAWQKLSDGAYAVAEKKSWEICARQFDRTLQKLK